MNSVEVQSVVVGVVLGLAAFLALVVLGGVVRLALVVLDALGDVVRWCVCRWATRGQPPPIPPGQQMIRTMTGDR